MRLLLSWLIIVVVYAAPAVGIYQFASHGSGVGALLCFAWTIAMSVICAKALEA